MFKVGRNLASRFSAPSSNIHLLSTELRVGGDSAVSEGNWGGGITILSWQVETRGLRACSFRESASLVLLYQQELCCGCTRREHLSRLLMRPASDIQLFCLPVSSPSSGNSASPCFWVPLSGWPENSFAIFKPKPKVSPLRSGSPGM